MHVRACVCMCERVCACASMCVQYKVPMFFSLPSLTVWISFPPDWTFVKVKYGGLFITEQVDDVKVFMEF